MKTIFSLFAAVAVLAGVTCVILRLGPSPTKEERKQMDVLSGQLFVFEGKTNEIKNARTISAFDGQHELMPYMRVLSPVFKKSQWPKGSPIRVFDLGDMVNVIIPLPPEIEKQPIRWGPDYFLAVLIDKKEGKIISLCQGS